MTATQATTRRPPAPVTAILYSGWALSLLRSAIEMGLFEHFAGGPLSAEALAAAAGLPGRGVASVLDALVALCLLDKRGGAYELPDVGRAYLLKASPLYLGDYVKQNDQLLKVWARLPECLAAGTPVCAVNEREQAEEFFPALAAAIFPLSYTTAQMVAQRLNVGDWPPQSVVLDIAAGSAVWSIPFAQANAGLTVDALDFPVVLATTREFTRRYGVGERYRYLSGDWRDIDLEQGRYDAVLLGHILHSEGLEGSRALLKKSFASIKPGGRLVVAEFMPDDERTGPAQTLLFDVNMFLNTSDGCVFTARELDGMLREAGFSDVQALDLPYYGKESPVMVATKR